MPKSKMRQRPPVARNLAMPTGFSFSGLHCGIKPDDAPDLALVLSETPCAAAALFTQNRYVAAPVQFLLELALRYDVPIAAIQLQNSLGDSTLLHAGQSLLIPPAAIWVGSSPFWIVQALNSIPDHVH